MCCGYLHVYLVTCMYMQAGEFKAHMQLTFLEVKDGTHQVPMTLPHQVIFIIVNIHFLFCRPDIHFT